MAVEQGPTHRLTAQPEATHRVVAQIGPQLAPHPDGEFVALRLQDLADQIFELHPAPPPSEQTHWDDLGYWITATSEPGINGYRCQAEYTLAALAWVRFGFSGEIPPRIVNSMDLEYANSKVRAAWLTDVWRVSRLPASLWSLLHNAQARVEDRRFKRTIGSEKFKRRLRTAKDIDMVNGYLDRRYTLVLTTMEYDLDHFAEIYPDWVRFLENCLDYNREAI